MNKDLNGNERSVYSVLKSEALLLIFAALISVIISVSFSFYLDFIKSYDQNRDLNKAVYFEVMRNNFAMWELMSNMTDEIKNDTDNRLFFCFPYDTQIYKSYSENPTSLPSETGHLLNEFYSILYRMNYICDLVMQDFKAHKPVQIKLKTAYFNLLQRAMNIGESLMRELEKYLDIPTNYDKEYNTKMKSLRKKVFQLHPRLKEKLGKPIFIYDENNNRMILKEYK
jgi:hypothetical protein